MAIMVVAAMAIFYLFQQRVADLWLQLAIHPEIQETLTAAANDQKTLAQLDSAQSSVYRDRFEQIQTIRQHLFILETHGRDVVDRYLIILLGLLIFIVGLSLGFQFYAQKKVTERIGQLRQPLSALASGAHNISLPKPTNDVLGRVTHMIGQTAALVHNQREKLDYLEHLSGWQEASRRHAHELRTPLTAARLETERLAEMIEDPASNTPEAIRDGAYSILEELDRIKRFTKEFTAFAKIRQPSMEAIHLQPLLKEFCDLFAKAWSNLSLGLEAPTQSLQMVSVDAEMIRQVLVNLGNNASKAMGDAQGTLTLKLSESETHQIIAVTDNGPGIPEHVRNKVFEPYATTSKVGEGMGLGLAISRKIMLDHQGDLRLHQTNDSGTCFQLFIPKSGS